MNKMNNNKQMKFYVLFEQDNTDPHSHSHKHIIIIIIIIIDYNYLLVSYTYLSLTKIVFFFIHFRVHKTHRK